MPSLRRDNFGGMGLGVLLGAVREAVVFVDPSGRVLLTNRAVADGLPESRSGMDLGAAAVRFRPDGQRYGRQELPVMRSVRSGEVVRDEECFRLTAGGARHSLSCRSAPIHDDAGAIVAAVLIERDVTRELRGQRQLANLTSVVENAGLAVIALDSEGRITAWNQGAARLYGWSAPAALDRPIRSLLKPALNDEQRAAIGAVLRTQGRWRGEISVRRRDGALLVVDATGFSTRGPSGEITGYVITHRDLRDEKRAAQELRAARAHADEILDRISDIVFAVDRHWRYTFLNRQAAAHASEALGRDVTAEDLLGQNCWEVFPDWTRSRFYETFQNALRWQRPAQIEEYVPRAHRWFDVRLYPSDTGLSIYLYDVTERRRAADQLAYHASLLANLDDAIIATNEEGVITAWNHAAEGMFGCSDTEAIGRAISEIVPTGRDDELARAFRELAETGRRKSEETRYRRDGSAVVTDSLTVALRDDHDRLTGYLGIARDVTERWGARRKLERGIAQQAAVAALGLRALQGESVSALLEGAASEVRRGLGAEYSQVDELLPDGQQVRAIAGAGWRPGIVGGLILPAGRRSLTGFALLTGGPVIVDDLPAETRFDIPDHLTEHKVLSAIAVVIDPLRRPFGTLVALSKQWQSFSNEDASFMQSLANVLVTAIDRADVERRLEEAREAERARIARDLHDETLRELNDAFALGALSRPVVGNEDDQERWTAVTEALRRVGERLRGAIYDLRPPTDDARALADLLADVVSSQSDMASELVIRLDGATSLPHGSLGYTGSELLRIVREAITNARCHSGATIIAVDTGRSNRDAVRIDIADDGRWPGRQQVVRGRRSTGIAGMFDRAERLGGTLRITGRKGGGTLVSIVLSLDRAAAS
ncbi:MAG TPA: PAS domain S-box protein [Solirubrobacteraceae bacterium]|jgi:PAS domain S-box-containing protein|nr:PAS domain S-box protein [Solirubrobacteraceae bacterium]